MIGDDYAADRIINIKGGLRAVKKNLPLKVAPFPCRAYDMEPAGGRQSSDVRAGGRRAPAWTPGEVRMLRPHMSPNLLRATVLEESTGRAARWPVACVSTALCRE